MVCAWQSPRTGHNEALCGTGWSCTTTTSPSKSNQPRRERLRHFQPLRRANHLIWFRWSRLLCCARRLGSDSMTVLAIRGNQSLWWSLGNTTRRKFKRCRAVKKTAVNPDSARVVAATVTTRLLLKNKLAIQSQTHLSRRQSPVVLQAFHASFSGVFRL